jgi:hypothetical protein
LSFYKKVRGDKQFRETYKQRGAKLQNGKMVLENPNRQLMKMDFCLKGAPSDLATKRFNEIKMNL